MRMRTGIDQLIACAPAGRAGLMPRTRYHQVPTSFAVSGSTTAVPAVDCDHVVRQGYEVRESWTSYVVAPIAGCHATSGESCTCGTLPALETTRPLAASPETHGVPPRVT